MTAPVRLQLSPEPRYLRLARLSASSLAADLDFGVDEIDDLRLAVDELCAVLLQGANGPLELVMAIDGDTVVIDGRCATGDPAPARLHPIAEELLGIVADDFSLETEDGHRTFHVERAPRADDET